MRSSLFFFAIVSLILIQSVCHGQVWCPPGASWSYRFSMPIPYPASGYIHFEAATDTTINGQPTRKIERTLYYHDWTSDQYGIEVKDPIFTHLSNDVVWIYAPAEAAFDTLYDMNAIPGAQWFLAAMP